MPAKPPQSDTVTEVLESSILFDSGALLDLAKALVPATLTLVAVIVALVIVNRLLLGNVKNHESDSIVGRQLVMLALTIVGIVAFILALPIDSARQGQLLGLLGLILSGAIALSSTNLLGNIMSGLMLRAVHAFRLGDFIEVGEEFGRVSERGLFHVEIQTPRREFVTVPNTLLVSAPVRVTPVRSPTGSTDKPVVVVSTTVSLGYDVPRLEIEQHLLAATERAGLHDPYVRVLSLGDYSVTYQVSGLYDDPEGLLAARSRINAQVLDALHGAGIEIVSPLFLNERAFAPNRSFIPRKSVVEGATTEPHDVAPAAVFDKATSGALRERFEELRQRLLDEIKELEKRVESGEGLEGEDIAAQIARAQRNVDRLNQALEDQEPGASE